MDCSFPFFNELHASKSESIEDLTFLSIFRFFSGISMLLSLVFVMNCTLPVYAFSNCLPGTPADTLTRNDTIIVVTTPISMPKLKKQKPEGFQFPLELGFEYGYLHASIDEKENTYRGWNAFIDINLYNKELFLAIDAGIYNNTRDEHMGGYASLGLTYRAIKENSHNIYLHFGIIPYIRPPIGIMLSVNYMYSISSI